MDDGNVIPPWSDLPKELVERIGQCLDTHIDVLRFRAVCTTWRSSIPHFKASPSLPLKLPSHGIRYLGWADFYLIESTVYLFQPLDDAYIGSSCRSWLVKVTQTLDGKMRVMNPVTDKQINPFKPPNDGQTKVLPYNMPKVLNLLDFRVSQVCKSYHAQRSRPLFNDYDTGNLFNKILLSTNHICNETNHYSLLAILQTGQLSYFNSGDEQWIKLKDASCSIVDIIVYKGKFYAVDQYGKTIKFDSSFNETIVSSFLCVGGTRRRLVESLEHLYLVDIVLDTAYDNPLLQNTLGIKMYRLDEEQHDWIAVHTLGDRIFFAGDDCCFSVSSQVFGDGRGNCIYYANNGTLTGENDDRLQKRGYLRKDFRPNVGEGESSCNERHSKGLVHRYKGLHHNTGVFIIEDGKLGSLLSFFNCAEIFWPPPSRLNQARSEALDAIHSSLSPIQTLSSEVADYQKKLLALEDSVANSTSQYRLFNHKSNGPLLHEKLEAPLNPTKDLSRLLAEHKYEEAFTAALQRNDASVLWWLCSQVDLRGFFSINPLPLSRGVLLSLLQQLACDVSKETSQKLSYMTDVLSCMLDMPTQK